MGEADEYADVEYLAVPEPGTILLFGTGVAALGLAGRKRQKKS